MKTILTFALALIFFTSCKKNVIEPQCIKQFTISSAVNHANYDIRIALPCNYDPEYKTYSTIYVLDGQDNLNFVAAETKRLSKTYAKNDVLVVSIGYGNDRATDYTPTKAQGEGGAPLFMKFIEEELIPRVQKEVAADTSRKSRVILGHSYGGLCGAYAFTKHNSIFGNYLLLSPSIWYDNEVILQYEKENRSNIKDKQQLVFVGLGEIENSGRMLATFEAFYQILKNNYPNTSISKSFATALSHSGSKNPNITSALEFYFQNK